MKQNINSELIKSSRLDRAWSQEHLAHISGLSIRTIQRVELTGAASLETIKALSSALEMPIGDLKLAPIQPDHKVHQGLSKIRVISVLSAFGLAASTLFFGNSVLADQVLLDMEISVNDQVLGKFNDLPVVDSEREIFTFKNIARLHVIPTITETDDILLSFEIFEFNGDDYELVSSPTAIFKIEGDGAIQSTSNNGSSYRVSIASKVK